jgi:hypothetical protein
VDRKLSLIVGGDNIRATAQYRLYNDNMTIPTRVVQRRVAGTIFRFRVCSSSTLAFAEDTSGSCAVAVIGAIMQQLVASWTTSD